MPAPEGAVGGSVTIAADDRHAGLRIAQFGTDDVYNALIGVADVVEANAELLAVRAKRIDRLLGDLVEDGQAAVGGGHIVVDRGQRPFGTPHPAAGKPQTRERLGAGDFVDQLQVDVKDRLLPRLCVDNVVVPDFLKHRAGRTDRAHWIGLRAAWGNGRDRNGQLDYDRTILK